jgi:predicted nicotinamide N-methyase
MAADAEAATRLIAQYFPLTPAPGVPEIRIHKATPRSGLWRFGEADPDFSSPYWAHWWGGGLALARHVLDRPEVVAGKRVLDLGAGSGIVGIAAAMAGAAHVLAADVDPYAAAVIPLNATANSVTIEAYAGDLTKGGAPDVDVVLVGDLFYDPELASQVTAFLERCIAAGLDVLIGDPHRAYLPVDRLELLAEYPGPDFGSAGPGDCARNAVFTFRQA